MYNTLERRGQLAEQRTAQTTTQYLHYAIDNDRLLASRVDVANLGDGNVVFLGIFFTSD